MATKSKRRPVVPAPTPAKKLPIWWIIGGLVGLALVAAIAVSISGEKTAASAAVEIGTPTVSGESLPPYSQEGADAAMGMVIPAVVGTDFDGEEVVIGPDIGPAGIAFLAHWCSHCRDEVPAVQAWLDGGAVPAAPIYSVATSIDKGRPNYPPWSWLRREGWSSPVLVDDAAQSVMQAFGGTGFPFWVFINERGEVVGRVAGDIGAAGVEAALQLAASG